MLTLEQMQKVRIVCLHGQVQKAVSALYEFGAIQVTRARNGTPDLPLPTFESISEQLIALRAMESMLKSTVTVEARRPPELQKLLSESNEIRREFTKVEQALKEVDSFSSSQARLLQENKALEPFRNLKVSPSIFNKSERLSFYYGLLKVSQKELFDSLKGMPAEVSFVNEDGKTYALVAFGKEHKGVLDVLLKGFSSKIDFPEISERTFGDAYARCQQDLASLESKRNKLLAVAGDFSAKHAYSIVRLRSDLEEHAKQAELSNKFGKTEFLETIEGWVTAKNFAEMEKALAKGLGGEVFVEKVETHEKAPSKLSNPKGIRRFEFLLNSFSLPDATELDPTLFIAITYPFIFGMIFGDIGYGLLTAAIGLFLRAKKKGFLRDVGGMMLLSGAWTVIFGFIFGEFFGGEEMLGYHLLPIIHRSGEGIALLFGLTLVVGVLHLALGFVIGIAANLRAKHFDHAWAKFFWLVVEAGMVAGIYSIVFKQPSLQLPAIAALLLGIAGLYKFEGIAGLVELPGLLSNGLSYLRIMALGLSGVIIALIVNQIPLSASVSSLVASASGALSGSFDIVAFLSSLLMVVLFAVMMALGHGLALGLGIFESGIQTLRLHYVEFFSKFYKGGGMPFTPLREKV